MRTRMKSWAILMAVLLLVCCTGCAAAVETFEDPQLRTYTEDMLDAIVGAEEASAYALVEDVVSAEDFSTVFAQMQALLAQVSDYDLELISVYHNTNVSNEETLKTITAAYRMTTDSGTYVVDVQTSSACQKLYSFVITPFEYTDRYSTGTLENMEGADVVQWLLLASNLISLGVAVLAVVDCCRRKPKAKAAWISICLFGFLSVGMTVGASLLRFNFYINWLFGYSAYICYGGGTRVIRLLLPVGAVVYLLVGRRQAEARVDGSEMMAPPQPVELEQATDAQTPQAVQPEDEEDKLI